MPSASPFGPTRTCQEADEIGGGKLCACALIGVVVQNLDAFCRQLAVQPFAGGIGVLGALLQVEDCHLERSDRFRPFDPRIVMARLDDGSDQSRDPNSIRAAMDRRLGAVGTRDCGLHGF